MDKKSLGINMNKTLVREMDAGLRLDKWIRNNFSNVTQSFIEKQLRTGKIKVNGEKAKASLRIGKGDEITVIESSISNKKKQVRETKARVLDRKLAFQIKNSILYIDDNIIVINKPTGLSVQGGTGLTQHIDGLLDELTFNQVERPRLVHRLDKDTSGVMVLGRNRQFSSFLSQLFRGHKIRKAYWAVVKSGPKINWGTIDLGIKKGIVTNKEKMVSSAEGQKSVTRYRVIQRVGRDVSWLALEPLTGRKHQLRVHCSNLDCPILGDRKYGGKEAFIAGADSYMKKLHLHARAIKIPLKDRKFIEVQAPLPEHMEKTWKFFGFNKEKVANFDDNSN